MDFGTASQASILTTLKSDLLNVSKSTSSANKGSIFTLERSICTLGADTVASSAEPFTAAFSALFSARFGSRVFIVPEQQNLLREWYRTDSAHRPLVLQRFVEKISKLNMGLEYDLTTGQIQLQPSVKSVVDAAYFGLARFMAVNANALDDYGGKTNIAFCQACGKAFIKRGNRQKYCGTLECQSVRNKLKSKEYYYRERAKGNIK